MKVSTALGSYLTVSHQCNKGDTVELKMSCRFFLEPFMDQENIAGRFYGPILLAVLIAYLTYPLADGAVHFLRDTIAGIVFLLLVLVSCHLFHGIMEVPLCGM